jgi:hypothetical protein
MWQRQRGYTDRVCRIRALRFCAYCIYAPPMKFELKGCEGEDSRGKSNVLYVGLLCGGNLQGDCNCNCNCRGQVASLSADRRPALPPAERYCKCQTQRSTSLHTSVLRPSVEECITEGDSPPPHRSGYPHRLSVSASGARRVSATTPHLYARRHLSAASGACSLRVVDVCR